MSNQDEVTRKRDPEVHAKLVAEMRRLAELDCGEFYDYVDKCPLCKGPLYVTSYNVYTKTRLTDDGFSSVDADFYNTDDEIVECDSCHEQFALWELAISDYVPEEKEKEEEEEGT